MPDCLTTYDAWIDVGGTFTDCITRIAGEEIRYGKVLSSGRVPVSMAAIETESRKTIGAEGVSELADDPDGFWRGAELVQIDSAGDEMRRIRVVEFQSGKLQLDIELDNGTLAGGKSFVYELDSGLTSAVLGTRRLLGYGLEQPLPSGRIRLGTTRGTNALLTRRGARTALAVTAPFGDLLEIGDQSRPELFALDVVKPEVLAECTIPISERLDANGKVLQELCESSAEKALAEAWEAGIRSLAICLMHSYVNPVHEGKLADIARRIGFEHVSVSSQLAPLIEIVARAQTTVVDAYLSPVIREYLEQLVRQFGGDGVVDLQVMTSAGGLVPWSEFRGKDSILSGPAGGVTALVSIADANACSEVIGLDMGGTSTDVCRVATTPDLQYESNKAGVRILSPTLPIETVAAGGGSICWFDGVSLRVGPQSAGAMPGPACYGRGGPLTLTDLNVYLQRIPEDQFPFELDFAAIDRRLAEVLGQLEGTGPVGPMELCQGFRRIANEQMAEAVRSVSIAQGADPRGSTLIGFGGAAGQHVCEIADLLSMREVLDLPEAGVLSALGMGLAGERWDETQPYYTLLSDVDWSQLLANRRGGCSQLQLAATNKESQAVQFRYWLETRYAGTESTLRIAFPDELVTGLPHSRIPQVLTERFHRLHDLKYGYRRDGHPIELVALRKEMHGEPIHRLQTAKPVTEFNTLPKQAMLSRGSLSVGDRVSGPVIVNNAGSTLFVDEGWSARCESNGALRLVRESAERMADTRGEAQAMRVGPGVDLVFRECYAARLQAIASQMGLVLQQTAISVNVKQRRDYSCAVFDHQGNLLANAPHVPVHLGAMSTTVREVQAAFPEMQSGDVFVTNDPYRGGSHLPDVTVITPVFSQGEIKMFVANRAHHADIGGISPGSMSIRANRLGLEGVIIPPMRLFAQGVDCTDQFEGFLSRQVNPPRKVQENIADCLAQVAANQRGVELLTEYATQQGWGRLTEYGEHLLQAAEQKVRNFVRDEISWNSRDFSDALDDGSTVHVSIKKVGADRLRCSFVGSAKESATNFNANPSIVRAALMYVLRCSIADDLPLNDGMLRALNVEIERGLLDPEPATDLAMSPAVAAGNVETSQRIVDVLLGCFQATAASQGTMNNVLFGNSTFGFYETIGGGTGATPRAPGTHAVHTHMTNTRLTDPEVLEKRYPVRLWDCSVREGSGGAGRHKGGDGMVRELEFLEPVTVSLLTSRRGDHPPFGLAGGQAGMVGRNLRIRDGVEQLLDHCCEYVAQPTERLRIETPGGGGWGVDDFARR